MPWIESIEFYFTEHLKLTFAPIMAEGGLFYAAMFTVVAGLGLIFGLGIVSFFNPYRGNGISQFNVHYSYLETLITVQVCHEHKKIDHGVLNFGLGYNGTILDGSVVTFRCYTGE